VRDAKGLRPIRLATGTRQSSNTSSRVEEARIPILSSLFPNPNPGVSFSTTRALAPRAPFSGFVITTTV
jgi:hypothetical protein